MAASVCLYTIGWALLTLYCIDYLFKITHTHDLIMQAKYVVSPTKTSAVSDSHPMASGFLNSQASGLLLFIKAFSTGSRQKLKVRLSLS